MGAINAKGRPRNLVLLIALRASFQNQRSISMINQFMSGSYVVTCTRRRLNLPNLSINRTAYALPPCANIT